MLPLKSSGAMSHKREVCLAGDMHDIKAEALLEVAAKDWLMIIPASMQQLTIRDSCLAIPGELVQQRQDDRRRRGLQAGLGLLRVIGRWAIGPANPRSTASKDTSIPTQHVQLRSRSGAEGVETCTALV
jgi:hypothetical protein